MTKMLLTFLHNSTVENLRKSLHKFKENKTVKKLMLIIYKKLNLASIYKVERA